MRRTAAAILGGLVILTTACTNELKGSVQATHAGQTWTVTPNECASGQRQAFFGIDAREADRPDASLRVLLDPMGNHSLLLGLPGGNKGVLVQGNEGCKTFDIHVERQSSSINNVANLQGHVRIDCDKPDVKVTADLTFANCH